MGTVGMPHLAGKLECGRHVGVSRRECHFCLEEAALATYAVDSVSVLVY